MDEFSAGYWFYELSYTYCHTFYHMCLYMNARLYTDIGILEVYCNMYII